MKPLSWQRARSIHARLALVAVGLALLILTLVSIGEIFIIHRLISDDLLTASQQIASQITADIRAGIPQKPILISDDAHVDFIQIVAPGGRVIASSNHARDLPPLTSPQPDPRHPIVRFSSCLPRGWKCVQGVAMRVTPQANTEVVYAAGEMPGYLTGSGLILAVVTQVSLLTVLIGWISWRIVAQALRPVGAIQSELAAITVRDLSRRVPQPQGGDEIARLAETANQTLDRMERAIRRQRAFAADAAHELRTPIAGIRAQLESGRLYAEDLPEAIDAALRDTGRLETILTDLMFFARVESLDVHACERLDVAAVVRRCLVLCPERAPRRARLPGGILVKGAEDQLTRAIIALIDSVDRYAAREVVLDLTRDDGHAALVVTSDGDDVAPENREHVFTPITRLDTTPGREPGSAVFGLVIAREVAEAHAGTLVSTCSPTGVTFILRLPLAADPLDPSAPGPPRVD
ncbi:histidine kinase dimerization/phospho-acceptor domain-containing protein [Herbidospora cretacea]|uniref:histidine kinase dimerization/phospho-acceptor domain-containing protein n=1 Tax=Herbidospora cretacea TaxID=28444 RepID=UPI00068F4A74|nr:histidine kinase dimerization/phospho-acceptor domain-containing protein [Herbidospora cretacea]